MDENTDLVNQEFIEINDLNILKNFNVDDIYIILNHKNEYMIAKINKFTELPVSETKKTKLPKMISFNFTSEGTNFDLNKSYNGTLDDWTDMGGELFSVYRVYKLLNNKKSNHIQFINTELSNFIRSPVSNKQFVVKNESRPNIRIKEKYLKYKAKYLQLKKQSIL